MRFLPALLLASGLLAAPGTRADALPMWEVTARSGQVVLLGSIHFLQPGRDRLPEAVVSAYESADVVWMELDLDDLDPAQAKAAMTRYGIDPRGRTLDALLGPAAWTTAQQKARALELDLAVVRPFEPWLAAITVAQLSLARLGYAPDAGVEQQLLAMARRDRKEIRGLETVEQQFAAMDALPAEAQREFLLQTLEDAATMDTEIDRLVDAWRSGDAQTMATEFLGPVASQPALYQRIVVDRNRAWAGELRRLLADGRKHLVVVGTLHLVGEDSVIAMLDDAGFDVRQLDD